MSEWHQPAIPGCYEHENAYYQRLGSECANGMDACIRLCEPPSEFARVLAAGLFDFVVLADAVFEEGTEEHVALVWAFILQNLDLIDFTFCMGQELQADPNNPGGTTAQDVRDCLFETLLGVDRLAIVIPPDGDRPYSDGTFLYLPDRIGWASQYALQLTDAGRLCVLAQQAGVILHETMHACGARHGGDGEVNFCEVQTVISRNFMWLIAQRYPCIGASCDCLGVGNLPWAYDIKGISVGAEC